MINLNQFNVIKDNIKRYNFLEAYNMEVKPKVFLNLKLKDKQLSIYFIDYNDNLQGGKWVDIEDVLNMEIDEFNEFLEFIHYFNVIEDLY